MPRQAHERLPEFSEQQINAAIQNLYKKGAGKLERTRQGKRFAYSAKIEKVRQRSRGRATAPMELPQEYPAAGVVAAVPVQETVAPATEKPHEESQERAAIERNR